MLMLFNKLTMISIVAIISIASILVFVIPTESIEIQSVINGEKPSINHTLSLDQSISVSEANNRVAINLETLENDTQKNIFGSVTDNGIKEQSTCTRNEKSLGD